MKWTLLLLLVTISSVQCGEYLQACLQETEKWDDGECPGTLAGGLCTVKDDKEDMEVIKVKLTSISGKTVVPDGEGFNANMKTFTKFKYTVNLGKKMVLPADKWNEMKIAVEFRTPLACGPDDETLKGEVDTAIRFNGDGDADGDGSFPSELEFDEIEGSGTMKTGYYRVEFQAEIKPKSGKSFEWCDTVFESTSFPAYCDEVRKWEAFGYVFLEMESATAPVVTRGDACTGQCAGDDDDGADDTAADDTAADDTAADDTAADGDDTTKGDDDGTAGDDTTADDGTTGDSQVATVTPDLDVQLAGTKTILSLVSLFLTVTCCVALLL